MNHEAVQQYISLLRQSYQVTSYQNKRKVIEEVCTNLGWAPQICHSGFKSKRDLLKKTSWKAQKVFCWSYYPSEEGLAKDGSNLL